MFNVGLESGAKTFRRRHWVTGLVSIHFITIEVIQESFKLRCGAGSGAKRVWNVTTWMSRKTLEQIEGFPRGWIEPGYDGSLGGDPHGNRFRNDRVAFGHHIRDKVQDIQGGR